MHSFDTLTKRGAAQRESGARLSARPCLMLGNVRIMVIPILGGKDRVPHGHTAHTVKCRVPQLLVSDIRNNSMKAGAPHGTDRLFYS